MTAPRQPKRAKPRPVVLGRGEIAFHRGVDPDLPCVSVELWSNLTRLYLNGEKCDGEMGTLIWQPAAPRRAKRKVKHP